MSERFAIYFAPAASSPWRRFGMHWLGRDETSGLALEQAPPPACAPQRFRELTAEPRRYGFHATLKAPFRLADGVTREQLIAQAGILAQRQQPIALGMLVPVYMEGFVALVPASRRHSVAPLAAQCVTDLDCLRAPLTPDDRERRRPERLDSRGRELLERYGYPHVLERFKFHLTLSGPVDAAAAGELIAHVSPDIARLNRLEPPVLDRLCVFHEPASKADFLRIADLELGR